MLTRLLSGDRPRSLVLTVILLAILGALAFAPFLFPGVRSLETAARICIFIVLVASYDLLLGYTGIVSFAHTMFFGLGAYGVALASDAMGRGWGALAVGTVAGALAAAVLAAVIGMFSLRVRAIFFAMITLAVASAVAVLVSQLSAITGGEDGLNYSIPRELTPAFRLGEVMGVRINGKLLNYYLVFTCCLVLFLVLLRVVNSPFGRVLQAIRENEFRAEAIGYRVVYYRIIATCLSASVAALAGSLFAIWLRYVGPDTTLSFTIMLDILLMVVIGGMGTIYGAVIGAAIFVLAQNYLQTLMGSAAEATAGLPLVPDLLNPDRWLLWLGVLFILSVYFFPTGIVGRLRTGR
ncbi:MAG: branched-chain amino acid ABC transporter permease [Marinovum algicola]|jgi:branched-chain amino acid transport system permease protein|uniref:Amino acid/amide ABC transporter membrane protein 2, HAAT family n=1 Tax=Marinovum algicola TaxID=42444 RepID=A0A975WAT2_9RHOB|nr:MULTISPECIES: branched-chain amino acid ABC transporter permease [Marinovum]MDD9741558.1 branched-chain amino acid ABC transporter permease [Marinovum sp. SP66]MDD9743747.1 branched-chain amino acid ABC transporter permease [Marinovum sp. PR37]SEJ64107.1 amino acid/amide ABC transporter membrane protein 2, HAAT family [Marinovum algicola]SLN52864.1 leucine/isoleucine/valine transporter permease subunit [Marinovum algicola]